MKKTSRFGKGTVSDNMLMCCVPDMAYGSHPRLPNPLSCKTLLICPICISKVLIEAPWFLIAASVEA
ncbi:hypothetical protein Tco_1358395 [Tanacetum coccineum]